MTRQFKFLCCPNFCAFLLFSSCFLSVLCFPLRTSAQHIDFHRPRMTFAFGVDTFDFVGGEFGKATKYGLAAYAETAMQVGNFAGYLRFGAGRGLTIKDKLPFDAGFQFVFLTIAPRFYWSPFRRELLYFFIQPEISMHILGANTLVSMTGNEVLSGAAGGSFGVQYILGIISVTAQVSCQYDWRFKTTLISGGISVGLSSTIQ